MYCKLLKLINGESVIGYTESDCNTLEKGFIELRDPVLVSSIRVPMERVVVETFVMQTWLKMSSSNIVKVPVSSVIVATDVLEKVESQYKHYLAEMSNIKLTDEELQTLAESSQEDEFLDFMEEEDDDGSESSGPTLH